MSVGRRSYEDEKWAATREAVYKRDGMHCRLLRVLSAKDAILLKRNAGQQLQKLDPAHIYPVSKNIQLTYELSNIVCLNRYSHEMLDTCRHPVTGASISREDVYEWWEQIAGKKQWEALMKVAEPEDTNE